MDPQAKQVSLTIGGAVLLMLVIRYPVMKKHYPRFRFVMNVLKIAIEVWVRRFIYGPKLPTWSFAYEVLLTFLQGSLNGKDTQLSIEKLPKLRRIVNSTAPPKPKSTKCLPLTVPHSSITGEWICIKPFSEEEERDISNPQVSLPPRYILDRIDSLSNHPVILYLHGGGYVSMSAATHRPITNKLAKMTQGTVLAINYKLAPEYPFPYGLIDALYTYYWLIAPRQEGGVGVKPSQVVIGGDSAGGGLTVATVLAILNAPSNEAYLPETYLPARENGGDDIHRMMAKISNLKNGLPLPSAVFVLSPWVDLECKGKSWEENLQYCYLRKEPLICEWYAGHHLSLTKIPLNNPLVSPVNGNFKNFPPLLIQVGAKETLLDDSVELSQKAKKDGVEVIFESYEDMSHVFQAFSKLAPLSVCAFQSIAQHVKSRVGKNPTKTTLPSLQTSRL